MYTNRPKFGPEQYEPGEVIVNQGDIPDKFYIIASGEVEIVLAQPDGSEEVINRLSAGDFFGEIGMLTRSRRVATVRAFSRVDVMAMDLNTFQDWLNSSMLSRDEINLVMKERISNVGELQPVNEVEEAEAAKEKSAKVEEAVDEESSAPGPPPLPAGETETGVLIYHPGNDIVRQGDIADKFYMIVEGEVEVVQQDEAGEEQFIARLSSGEYFGEIGLMEGKERMATVRAVSQVHVMAFDRNMFSHWVSQAPFVQDEIKFTAQERLSEAKPTSVEDDSPN